MDVEEHSPLSHDEEHFSPLPSGFSLSFEFFPPRNDEQALILESTWRKLVALDPAYFSVTFGAGGSTLAQTREVVLQLQQESGVPAAPHLSCVLDDDQAAEQLLNSYRDAGIRRLVVLRGDNPAKAADRHFTHADDLVRFIRERFGDSFAIEVGCYPEFHPETEQPGDELRYFRQKMNAGADGAITQYFYNADSYFAFVEDARAAGVTEPITPGIMPITNFHQLARFSDFCGAEIPLWIRKRLEGFGEDLASIRDFGEEVVTGLCERLLAGGAPGLHYYTLNRANATLRLCRNLGFSAGGAAEEKSPGGR